MAGRARRDWDRRVATAERLIADADATGVPVLLAFTAEKPNAEIGPFDAAAARDRLRAAEPRPIPVDRPAVYARVAAALEAIARRHASRSLPTGSPQPATRRPSPRCSAAQPGDLSSGRCPTALDMVGADRGRERGRRLRR